MDVVGSYQSSIQDQSLLSLPFRTIFEYLFYLRAVAVCLGRGAMVYLAAAVADFYVPHESMVGGEELYIKQGVLGYNSKGQVFKNVVFELIFGKQSM